jgi:hypothetical protein
MGDDDHAARPRHAHGTSRQSRGDVLRDAEGQQLTGSAGGLDFRMMVDFIRAGRLQPPYGTASLSGVR